MKEQALKDQGIGGVPVGERRHARITPAVVGPAAGRARFRHRHFGIALSFVLIVLVPFLASALYLGLVAADQYESRFGFSVRKEDAPSPAEILGGITELSSSSSKDTDFLYKYIQGRQMVERVNERLDLRAIYTRPDDPVFGLAADATIEDLERYWNRMVTVFYDSHDGLIEVRVLAFTPEDAQNIAQAILEESGRMLNELVAVARVDSTRYAKDELDRAVERLKSARQTMTEFRTRTQIVDPSADIEGRMGILNTLQAELATALIDLDLLRNNTSRNDPRIVQTEQRIEVIRNRIRDERANFSSRSSESDLPYSQLVGEFEALMVEQQFAEKNYVTALAAYEAALADAQRQSRYLAPYVAPTRAQVSQYPRAGLILTGIAAFLTIGWLIAVLVYYSLRDRQ